MARNQDIYFAFDTNPSLADSLADKNPGDVFEVTLKVQVKSKDDKGLSGTIEPDSVVPEGYEPEEETEDSITDTTPPPQPPGSLVVPPITQVMNLRKKGKA